MFRMYHEAMENYKIVVKGHLDKHWESSFSGMSIQHSLTGDSVISGPVVDQAALYGIIRRISGMNLTLIYLERIDTDNGKTAG